jgi:hypothetical protein
MASSYLSAKAWNAEADRIRKYNKSHEGAPKRLPSIDRVRSTAWMLTIPADKHELQDVKDVLESGCYAAVFSEEAGSTTGYRHYQTLVVYKNRATGTQVRGMFSDAHVEPARKILEACRQYVSKEKTHISGPYWIGEYASVPGMTPNSTEERRRDLYDDLNAKIESGCRYDDFVLDAEVRGWALSHKQQIQDLISAHAAHLYGEHDREISVDYVWGPAGSMKTSSVYDLYGRRNVFAADFGSAFPFDGYAGEPVLLLDDFRSSFVFNELLRVLDRYPLRLNIKGGHTWACWTKVVISANISLTEQYPNLSERKDPMLRRFEHGIVFEKTSPAVALPYASREDAMKGIRNDGGTNGVPGYTPMWEREQTDGGFSDADFDGLLAG